MGHSKWRTGWGTASGGVGGAQQVEEWVGHSKWRTGWGTASGGLGGAQQVEDWVGHSKWKTGWGTASGGLGGAQQVGGTGILDIRVWCHKECHEFSMCVGTHVPYEELSFKRVQRHFKSIGCLHKNTQKRTETDCRPQSHQCQLKVRT